MIPRLKLLNRLTLAALTVSLVGLESLHAFQPAAINDEHWYVVKMKDPQSGEYAQCGYMHAKTRQVGDEVHSDTKLKIELRRGAAEIQMLQDQHHVETLSGHPKSFRFIASLGTDPETVSGTVTNGKLTLVSEQYGQVKERTSVDFDPEIRFPHGAMLFQKKQGLTPGAKYAMKTYEPSLRKDGPIETRCEVIGPSTQDVLGRDRKLTQIRSTLSLGGTNLPAGAGAVLGNTDLVSDVWVDENFTPVVISMNVGFIQMRMYETSKEDAMKRGAPPEMFLETFVRTQRQIGRAAKQVTLRLRMKEGAGTLPDLPITPMQQVTRKSPTEVIVTTQRNDWNAARQQTTSAPVDDIIRPMLGASAVCDAKDAKIRRLAKREAEKKKTPAEKADALREFVTRYIKDKNMDVGFATASDVVRNRAGDCTEHAVLLAALCRAAGVPARGVSGIVEIPEGYLPGDTPSAFGYHMWTQVYIGGKWIDIDAALRQTDCDPNRVALAIMPLGDEGLAGTIASLVPLIGQLEIEVLDVTR